MLGSENYKLNPLALLVRDVGCDDGRFEGRFEGSTSELSENNFASWVDPSFINDSCELSLGALAELTFLPSLTAVLTFGLFSSSIGFSGCYSLIRFD